MRPIRTKGNIMEKSKIDMFLMTNKECFTAQQWGIIKEKLISLPEDNDVQVLSTSFKNPTNMLIISIFLGNFGVDRFMLGDTGLGIAKLLTCGGCGIWTIIDWFSIKQKTYDHNFKLINDSLMF